MSCKICPFSNRSIFSPLMALIIDSGSPSTISLWKPNSLANQRARRTANTSTISTDVGSGIFCDRAAITNLLSLRIITPRPALLSPAKSAPSKFTFTRPAGGGRYFTSLDVRGSLAWMGRSWWNSWSVSLAMDGILESGTASSSRRTVFLRSQIRETIQANKSNLILFCYASWITLRKLKLKLEAVTKAIRPPLKTSNRQKDRDLYKPPQHLRRTLVTEKKKSPDNIIFA